MDLKEGSETSAKHNLTPGKHPKEHVQDDLYVFSTLGDSSQGQIHTPE
jgi:hypothetical protein